MATQIRYDGQKDPETLEREIDEVRAEMSRTLEALERKFSPGQWVDYYLDSLREHSGELAANFGNTVKQNPVPITLTAIGLAWTILASNRPKPAYGESVSYGEQEDSPGFGEKLKSTAEGARNRFGSSRDAVRDKFSDTARNTQDRARRAREGLGSLIEEQPLILGALGIALGAAIGASLPRTEQEDRLMGKVRDNAVGKIKEQGSHAYDEARDRARAAAG